MTRRALAVLAGLMLVGCEDAVTPPPSAEVGDTERERAATIAASVDDVAAARVAAGAR